LETSALVFLYANRIDSNDIPPESLVLELHHYWRSLARADQLPSRSQIDPVDIARILLPWIFMVDVLNDGCKPDYRYRLAGTSNVRLVGRDPTGKLASSIFRDDDRTFMMETFHTTVRERQPTYWHAAVPHDKYHFVNVYRGIFPLSSDGEKVDILIAAAVPERGPPKH
jgi:hypothetical protein